MTLSTITKKDTQKSTQKDWQKHHQEACGPTKRHQEEQQKVRVEGTHDG